ncbi:hypothetical protein V8E36_002697 [Tilletia maclaganii]
MIAAAFSRTALRAAAASTSRQVAGRGLPVAASSSSTSLFAAGRVATQLPAASSLVAVRTYASGGGPSVEDIEKRIKDVLASFEKVKPNAITPSASFTSDLGLDSLDAVEVVMAIEEEFNIEIPDEEADNITTVQQAIDYVSHAPEAV